MRPKPETIANVSVKEYLDSVESIGPKEKSSGVNFSFYQQRDLGIAFILSLIKNFKGIFKKIITFKIPEESNALSSFDLKKISEKQGFKTVEAKNIKDALNKLPNSKRNLIVIFGSLYLVGHVLSIN